MLLASHFQLLFPRKHFQLLSCFWLYVSVSKHADNAFFIIVQFRYLPCNLPKLHYLSSSQQSPLWNLIRWTELTRERLCQYYSQLSLGMYHNYISFLAQLRFPWSWRSLSFFVALFSKYAPLIYPPTSCQQYNPRFTIFTHQIIYWLCSSLGTTLLESSSLTLSPEQVLSRPAGSSPKHILMMLCPCACAGCLVSQVPRTLYSLLWEISPSGTFLSRGNSTFSEALPVSKCSPFALSWYHQWM